MTRSVLTVYSNSYLLHCDLCMFCAPLRILTVAIPKVNSWRVQHRLEQLMTGSCPDKILAGVALVQSSQSCIWPALTGYKALFKGVY